MVLVVEHAGYFFECEVLDVLQVFLDEGEVSVAAVAFVWCFDVGAVLLFFYAVAAVGAFEGGGLEFGHDVAGFFDECFGVDECLEVLGSDVAYCVCVGVW